MKVLKRIFFYLLLTVSVLLIAVVSAVFLFKDRIISRFISEANKQLNTPVNIDRIDVSVFERFPLLSIVCTGVYIEDSHPGMYPLFTAEKVSFQLNPLEAWQGIYTINGLAIHGSETNLKLTSAGVNNFTIGKKRSGAEASSLTFELRDVELSGTRVYYTDLRLRQYLAFSSADLVASIRTRDDLYHIDAVGDVATDKLEVAGRSFLAGKSFHISSNLVYDDIRKSIAISPSRLQLSSAHFNVKGTYTWKEKNLIHMEMKGENTDIQTLISLLPGNVSDRLAKYESRGDVYFTSRLDGEIGENTNPAVSIEFGFSNATLYHPDYRSRIENATVRGSYASPDLFRVEKAALVLKNASGTLNGEAFTSNLVITNFEDPDVICDFRGKVDAAALLSFYPIGSVHDAGGSLLIDIDFEGRIGLLKNKATAQRVSALGSVELQAIDVVFGKEETSLQDLTGSLQFSNNDLALSNVSGKLGNSDFLLNGFFKNIITFVFFENQPVGIEADLRSRFLDLDQIFAVAFGSEAGAGPEYNFSISRNVNLNFNCDIASLRYKRFKGKNLKGDLLVKSQMAVSRNFSLQTMGGELGLSGIVDAQNSKAIDVVSTAKLRNIHIDSVFYVFENFNQDFIQDRHLKGQAFADVALELALNQHLELFDETLIADIGVTVKNGQLNNFEPMRKLSRYLDDEGLDRLRFTELKNDIHIENKTVYLPQMEVRSNVTDMVISGIHTFDQHISYRVVTPLRRKKPADPEAQLAIDDDPQGGPKLFLKIVGTTDDYRVSYDTEAVKKKIAGDLRKEVQELKDAFRNKGKQRQKELELEKDDYFDWEEN